VPREFTAPIVQTGDVLSGFADMLGIRGDSSTPLGQLRAGFDAVKDGATSAIDGRGGATEADMEALADEILAWMIPGSVPPVPPPQQAGKAEPVRAGAGAGVGAAAADVVTPRIVTPPQTM
jgi:hypothetical protein